MGTIKNLTGQKFGRLTVIRQDGVSAHKKALWLCSCDCGKFKTVIGGNLKSGITTSCGCFNLENITKHGDHKTAFYRSWQDIHTRCKSPKCAEYKNYGGRGISVCPEWGDYMQFKKDMLSTYQKGLTLDRIDVNGNYEPNNCKWSTVKEQNRNRRNNRRLDTPWGNICAVEAAERVGISKEGFLARLRKGLTGPALFRPKETK